MTQLPTEAGVKDLLSMMVGSEVGVQYAAQPTLGLDDGSAVGALARYADDLGEVRAVAACDLPLAAALSAALALLPQDKVQSAVDSGDVPPDLAENLREVFNVGTNLLNAPDRPHLTLVEVLTGEALAPDLVQVLTEAVDRLDLDVRVPGYGEGPFAVVAVVDRSAGQQAPADGGGSADTDTDTDTDTDGGAPAPHSSAAASQPGVPTLDAFDFEAPLPLPATAPRLVSRVQDVSPRIGVALSVACGRTVTVSCTGAERVSSGHLAQPGTTWCFVDCGLHGRAILVVPTLLTVVLADTLMGGNGAAAESAGERAATTLEQRLVLRHLGPALHPLVTAFAGNGLTALTLGEPETQALPVSIGDLVALRLLTSVDGAPVGQQVLTLALPARALLPGPDVPLVDPSTATANALAAAPVQISLRLEPTVLSAWEVDELRPGDVVRLEHAVDQPLVGLLDDRPVLHASLGRRGRRRAVLVHDVLGDPG